MHSVDVGKGGAQHLGVWFHISLLALQPDLMKWKHPKTTHLTSKVDILSRNILLSHCLGLLCFTSEFPEAL